MSLTMTFQAKDDTKDENNIRNEFYIPELVTYCYGRKCNGGMRAEFSLGNRGKAPGQKSP